MVVTFAAVMLRRTRWATVSLRASRWTYALFPLTLLYFPAKAGWHMAAPRCEWTFGPALAVHSLTNVPHIILFAIFFLITYAQLPGVRRALLWSALACLAMGLLVELAQGATGVHNYRMRDLIPDAAGAAIGALFVAAGRGIVAFRRA